MRIPKLLLNILTFLSAAAFLQGCYTMPTEDDYSLIPSTNNPDMTRQRGESGMPQMPI